MSGGIHCLVFSKDRAMQLDAFLRSQDEHAPYESVTVLCSFTENLDVADSYSILRSEYHTVTMLHEGPSASPHESLVRWWLQHHERVVFHTDDDVFFRKADLLPTELGEWQTISYRLGGNTRYCHPLDRPQALPPSAHWKWREADGDFGYPLCLNATVYRSADLLPLLQGWHFQNPTELEAGLAYRAELYRPEWMTAPLHSCCVSLPHNRVSSSSGCRTGSNPLWQPDSLRDLYLDGYRIDLDRMDFSNIVGAHQEVPLRFYKP